MKEIYSSVWCILHLKFSFFFPLKRQSVKQKFTLSCFGRSKFGCTMYRSHLLEEREGESLELVRCQWKAAAQSRLLLWCWRRVKGGDWQVGRLCTVSIWGWWDRGDRQPRSCQSITSWQWLSHTTSAVVAMANGESATGGVIRSCQSNTRSLTMTSVIPLWQGQQFAF